MGLVPLMVTFWFEAQGWKTAALGSLSLRKVICHKGPGYIMNPRKEETSFEEMDVFLPWVKWLPLHNILMVS